MALRRGAAADPHLLDDVVHPTASRRLEHALPAARAASYVRAKRANSADRHHVARRSFERRLWVELDLGRPPHARMSPVSWAIWHRPGSRHAPAKMSVVMASTESRRLGHRLGAPPSPRARRPRRQIRRRGSGPPAPFGAVLPSGSLTVCVILPRLRPGARRRSIWAKRWSTRGRLGRRQAHKSSSANRAVRGVDANAGSSPLETRAAPLVHLAPAARRRGQDGRRERRRAIPRARPPPALQLRGMRDGACASSWASSARAAPSGPQPVGVSSVRWTTAGVYRA